MRRLGAITGLPALLSLSLAYYLGNTFIYVAFVVMFFVIILSVIIKKYRNNTTLRIICLSAMVSLMVFSCYTSFIYLPTVKNYSDKELNVTATVKESPYKSYGYCYYYINTLRIDNKEDKVSMLLKTDQNINVQIDDIVFFYGNITVTDKDSYKSKGYFLTAESKGKISVISPDSHSLMYYPSIFRDSLEEVIDNNMSENLADICNALAFGDKANINNSTKEIFREAGLSHILVVSGLHLSILCFAVQFVLKKLIRKRYFYCPLTILFVLLYMFIAGFSPSIIRSGIMMIIVIIGEMIWREPDSLNSLGIAGLFLILNNPYSAGDVGLMLSFSATLGIVLFSRHIYHFLIGKIKFSNRKINWISRRFLDVISVTISAVITTAPITILFFKKISLTQLPSNLLIEPIFQILLICIFLGALLGLTGVSFLYIPVIFVAERLADYVLFVAKLMSDIPFGYVNADKPFVYVCLFVTGGLIIALIPIKNYKSTVPYFALVSALVFFVGMIVTCIYDYSTPYLMVYRSGNGICATVSHKGETAVLSCGGSKSSVVNSIENDYDSITILSATSSENKSSKYFDDILSMFDLKGIFIYDDSVYCKNENVLSFKNDHTVDMGDMIVTYLVRKDKVFTYAQCVGKDILIIPSDGDCRFLDGRYRTPDIVITCSAVKNDNLIYAEEHIICCTQGKYSTLCKENSINSGKVCTTYMGDIKESLG